MTDAQATTRPPSLLALYDPQWEANPYPLYRQLRSGGAVGWDEWMRTWLVLGYDEIVSLSKDDRVTGARIESFYAQLPAAAQAEIAPLKSALADMMLFNEPPRHTRLRQLIKPGLTPRFIRQLRPLVEEIADELLDQVVPSGRMDVIRDFSEPLTRRVVGRLAGVPDHALHLLRDWPGLLHEFFTQSRKAVPRLTALRAVFDADIEARRAGDAQDLFSEMIAGQLARADYTDEEIFANFLLLIDAGQATTTHLIGNAVLALVDHPDEQRRLREQPELSAGAAHEFLRYDSPVQFTSRVALDDIEIAGCHIRQGDSVTLVLGSGNRDPEHYADPDRLDVTRRAADQLSFGHGIHYCLGAALAVTEIDVGLAALLRRAGDLRLVDAKPDWLESVNFRFLQRLPITFTPLG
ncbi:cytochrome P450 [Micromonospora sp. NBC_01405]|uniref:cytochrome P450 n=1 Tax=Micromonospora sp. NBC_01405 TaxID=2903589 RepID=UPI00324D4321